MIDDTRAQRLRALERRVYRPSELPSDIADDIEAARMDPAYDHLNDLLSDE